MGTDEVACQGCGHRADGSTATWSIEVGPDGLDRLCDDCTREHLRSIEARLDERWWEPPAR